MTAPGKVETSDSTCPLSPVELYRLDVGKRHSDVLAWCALSMANHMLPDTVPACLTFDRLRADGCGPLAWTAAWAWDVRHLGPDAQVLSHIVFARDPADVQALVRIWSKLGAPGDGDPPGGAYMACLA